MSEVKDFYGTDTEGETLGSKLPDGTYLLSVAETEVGEWDDGRPRLDISTKVIGGEFDGRYGPRLTLSVGGSSGVAKKTGKEFTISDEDAAKRFRVTVKMIHPAAIRMRNSGSYDAAMLEDVGKALTDRDVFIARVKEDANGYPRIDRVNAVDDPPKGFTDPRLQSKFSIK